MHLPRFARRAPCLAFVGSLVGAVVPSHARAQDELFSIEGDVANTRLGFRWGVAPLGDVDGDGTADFAISDSRFDGVAGVDCGRTRIISGKTLTVLRTWEGENAGDQFGYVVRDVLDLDGDGVHDLSVGAINYPAGASNGKVYVYSGATGALIRDFTGENPNDLLCYSRGVGDATGDGVNDLVVTAFGFARATNGFGSGKVYLYSGADGSLYNSWLGASGAEFGFRLAALGFDADGDGCNDFVIGSREMWTSPKGPGRVEVYSAKSATPIVSFVGTNAGDARGYTNDAADVDGDGVPDLLVGAVDSNGGDGDLCVYSGADWSLLRTFYGTPELPFNDSMAMAGDVDGDGFGDVLISYSGFDGPAGVDSGMLALFSGANGRELTRWYGEQAGEQLGGNNTYGAGDLDGDGHPDQFAAAFLFDGAAGVECGKVYAFQGNDLYLNVTPDVAHANDTVTLTTTAGAPGHLVIDVLTELDGTPMFLLITPVVAFDSNGELSLSGVVDPSLGVHDLKLQSYAIGRSGKLVESSVRSLALR